MKPLRVLHTESSLELGGQEFRILAEAVGMQRRGHTVVLALPPGSRVGAFAERHGLCVVPVRMAWARLPGLIGDFLSILRNYQIDILNTHGSIDSWIAGIAGRLSGRKLLLIRSRHKSTLVRTTFRHRILYKRLPHGIITTAECIRVHLLSQFGLEASRVVAIPTGIDLKQYQPRKSDKTLKRQLGLAYKPVIGTVAFLRDYKGLGDFLEAARLISQHVRDARFLIVGDGPERISLAQKVDALSLSDRVLFTGFREDIPRLLGITDVFVLSSVGGEGTPQTLLQAMAMERPVVATAVGGMPEVVKHRETGLLVPPRAPEALAESVLELAGNQVLGQRLGKAGQALVLQKYDLERMLQQVEAFYERLDNEVGAGVLHAT